MTPATAHDHNRAWDVFVKDRLTGRTELVSADASGREGNDHKVLAFVALEPISPRASQQGTYKVSVY